ncbi:MAG: acyltransferase family protein [Clostridia bacterium]|nr:acyltransferase family protein [Clostridia bacterium]
MIANGETNIIRNNERIEWIDALKGFAIFCVTLGHLNMWGPIEKWIYSFHMFLFFFLSGFLFSSRKPTMEILKARVKRILIPYIGWNVISSLIGMLFFDKSFSDFVEDLFILEGNHSWNTPIWFLLVLFLAEIIITLLKLYKHKWLTITTIVICLGLWILIGHKWLLWKLNLLPMAICFFLLGFIFKPLVSKIHKWYILLLLGIGSIVFSSLNIRIIYTYGKFGNYVYCVLAAVCGTLFFIGLFSGVRMFSRLRFLKVWGRNSMIIMATQFFVFKVVSFLSVRLLNIDLINYKSTVVALILALSIAALINLLVVLFKKYTSNIKFLKTIGEIFGIQY